MIIKMFQGYSFESGIAQHFYLSGLYFIDALFNMHDLWIYYGSQIYMKDVQPQISNLEKFNCRCSKLGFGIIT